MITKMLSSALILSSLLVVSSARGQSFTDTTQDPEAQAIESLRSDGVIEGYPDGTYRSRIPINRAEFLAILLRSEVGESAIDDLLSRIRITGFPDVASDSWHWRYVTYAYASGIVSGYPDGMFRPGRRVNIAEAAKIAANVFEISPVSIHCFRAPCDEQWWAPFMRALEKYDALPWDAWEHPGRWLDRGEMATLTYVLKNRFSIAPCVRGGCSGQLCISEDKQDDAVTTCEWRESYACYEHAVCERQADGQCGWTPTPVLSVCLGTY